MSRVILVYGQPASGKTYALRNLDPTSTVIIDGDRKNALAWRGWKKKYSKEKKNFFPTNDFGWIIEAVTKIGAQDTKSPQVKTVVIDGLNTLMTNAKFSKSNKDWSKWEEIARDFYYFFQLLQEQRDDLTFVVNAHVENADPNTPNAIDKIKTPGKQLDKIGLESLLVYVFYAKAVDGEYFFETQPNNSSARSPEGCFEMKIPNDIAAAIKVIEAYEEGENAS